MRNIALDALVDLINDIKAEKAKGATDTQLAQARDSQRRGQFMIDFVMSENSMGFHAPQEATRILGERSTSAAWDNSASMGPVAEPQSTNDCEHDGVSSQVALLPMPQTSCHPERGSCAKDLCVPPAASALHASAQVLGRKTRASG